MIRKITEQDIEWINNNYCEDMDLIWLQNEFQSISHNIWFWSPWFVYIDEEKISWFILWESCSFRSYWEINKLYVFEKYRKSWIWTQLLKKLEDYFISIWLKSCELLMFTENWKQFYIKNWYDMVTEYNKKYHLNDQLTKRILLDKKL